MTLKPNEAVALRVAERYFELSNNGDLAGIRAMMTDATTYSSAHTGVYLGVETIMSMQTGFHAAHEDLHWEIEAVEEERPGVFRFDFVMTGRDADGNDISRPGIEYIIVQDGLLRHIEIRTR